MRCLRNFTPGYSIVHIPLPKSYYIVASNDIGPTLQDLLDNSAQLLSSLLDNWDTYCRFKITKSKEINLDADLLGYIRSFDFSIIKTYPIAQIIDEHLNTVYGSIRFGTRTPTLPAPLSPSAEIDPEEMEYVSALLAAYSEELGMIIDTPKALETIVIENEIPEIDYSNVNLIHFTKNANTGRYGFLIDVMD